MSKFEKHMEQLFNAADDSQYLKAAKIWKELQKTDNLDVRDISDQDKRIKLAEILHRASEVQAAMEIENISIGQSNSDQTWTLGAEYWGLKTYYQIENNNIRVRMEGGIDDLPLFEQCAVIHEVDLFKEWVPFCSDSRLIEKIGRAELIFYLCVSPLMISRDACMHAYGADCLYEFGQIILIGRSIDHVNAASQNDAYDSMHKRFLSKTGTILQMDANHTLRRAANVEDAYSCPWRELTWRHKRMEIIEFKALFKPTSGKAASAVIVGTYITHILLTSTFWFSNLLSYLIFFNATLTLTLRRHALDSLYKS